MKGLAGVGALTRLILRRDLVRLLVWILAVVGLMVSFAASSVDLYPTPESLQARAVIMDSPLGVAFSGPRIGLDNYTFGAMLSNEYVGFVAVALALMSVFLVVRNTRVEEQTGRAELVRAAVVGRNAAATATLLVVVGAQLVIGVLIALLLPGTGLDLTVEGSWLFAAAVVSVGVVFAAVALVAAQVTSHSRTAVGVGAAAVGAAYLIRAIGDVGDSALSMLSPIGWAQVTKPFVADAWWPLLISVGFFVVTTWVAFALSARRDLGEGLVAARPGPADAEPALGRPLGLAFRLQKGLLIGWGVGLFVLAASYGGFVADVERFASENPFIEEALSAIGGGTLGENWASFLALFMVALVSSFAVQAILRLRSEEVGQRAEPVLAPPVDRWRWMGSPLRVAAAGTLGALGQAAREATPALLEASTAPEPRVRASATLALAKVGREVEETVPALIRALEDAEPAVRFAAAQALGGMGLTASEAVPGLVRTLRDPNPSVQQEAIRALGNVGPAARAATADLRKLAENDQLRSLRPTVAQALAKIEGR